MREPQVMVDVSSLASRLIVWSERDPAPTVNHIFGGRLKCHGALEFKRSSSSCCIYLVHRTGGKCYQQHSKRG
jgi:hypothetical protein